MKLRFLADADLKRAIIMGVKLREPLIDFLSAQDASIEGLKDREVLAIAAHEDRVLISHDFGTMPLHFRNFISQQHSPGVFLVSQAVQVVRVVESVLMIWALSVAAEWENQLTYLPL